MTRGLRALALAGATAALAACGALPRVGPDYAGPPAQRSLMQAEAARAGAAPSDDGWQAPRPHRGAQADLARWWAQFDDPALDAFLAAAQRESGTLAQAASRIEQARAAAIGASAAGLPTLDATAGLSRGTNLVGTTILTARRRSRGSTSVPPSGTMRACRSPPRSPRSICSSATARRWSRSLEPMRPPAPRPRRSPGAPPPPASRPRPPPR
jgi:hypothetical protein